jgi:hypothetical protein
MSDTIPGAPAAPQSTRQQRRALERQRRKDTARRWAHGLRLSSGTLAAVGAVGAFLAAGEQASAATFTVSNLSDGPVANPGDLPGALRQALFDANGTPGPDVIAFQAGLTGTITLTAGQLPVTDSVDIQGPGAAALAVSGGNSSRAFYLYQSAAVLDVTISGLTIEGGSAGGDGAGILDQGENLTLDGVVLSGSQAGGNGGGLAFLGQNAATLSVERSTFSGNNASGEGGGIFASFAAGLTLRDSTISGNSATSNGGGTAFYFSGGSIENCTLAGNTTAAAGGGAALLAANVSFEHATVTGNSASTGGGIYDRQVAGVLIANSIVADNDAAVDPDLANDSDGVFVVSYSLVRTPGGSTIVDNGGSLFNQDPQLGPLQNNGGPTLTEKPALASPVVNAGDPAFTPPPADDQRGLPRISGGRTDMGSVELQVGTLQFSLVAYSVNENGGTATITVTRTGGSEGAVAVDFATSDGTAMSPADYLPASGTLNWADGDATPMTFQVTIVDDMLDEPDETVNLTLSNAVGAGVGAPGTAVLRIVDDDLPIAVATIPTLGGAGEATLAAALGAAGYLLLRRRKATSQESNGA